MASLSIFDCHGTTFDLHKVTIPSDGTWVPSLGVFLCLPSFWSLFCRSVRLFADQHILRTLHTALDGTFPPLTPDTGFCTFKTLTSCCPNLNPHGFVRSRTKLFNYSLCRVLSLQATTWSDIRSTLIPSCPFDLLVDKSAAGARKNHGPLIKPLSLHESIWSHAGITSSQPWIRCLSIANKVCIQPSLIYCSPTLRVSEVERKFLKCTFTIHPSLSDDSFVLLKTFHFTSPKLYNKSHLYFDKKSSLLLTNVSHPPPLLCCADQPRKFENLSWHALSILDLLFLLSVCARCQKNIQIRSSYSKKVFFLGTT